jgi:hypothetical protein
MKPDNTGPRKRRPRQRSRVGNGHKLIAGCDGRGRWVRRLKDLIDESISDMGGVDNTSAAERHIIRRACVLIVELERLEGKFAQAGEVSVDDLDCYGRTASNMRRLFESVGLQRRARDVTPDPLEYAARSEHKS